MTIAKRKTNWLEGFGLIFILFSFFVQMVETGIENDIIELQNYQIHKKLDYIWSITSHDYSQKYPEQGEHFVINFKSSLDDYKIYSQDYKELNDWQKLVKYGWFTNTRLALFIIGSIMLIIPKFLPSKVSKVHQRKFRNR